MTATTKRRQQQELLDATDTRTVVVNSLNTPQMRRILASSFIGTAIEYYDFILYAVASAVVFGHVFFTQMPEPVAIFASFATLAVGYVARPLGGVIFGHFGDRIGRKKMLVLSMLMMGAATTVVGLLPTTAQIGVVAPMILICVRLIQGFAVGGEWGGAALMAMEHAPQRKRGFATSFANAGGPAGAILARLVVSLMSAVAGQQFLVWGWRIPFLLSSVLIVVGLIIRLRISESPLFQKLERSSEKRKLPLLEVLTHHWRAVVLALLATMSFYCCQGIVTVWGVAASVEAGADRTEVLNWKALGAVVTLVVTFASARLSDRVGRKKVLIAGGVLGVVAVYPLLLLLSSGTVWGFATADVIGNGVIQGLLYGPIGAFIAEQFPTRVRYTGASLAYQGASTLGAGFTPMIVSGLLLVAGGSLWLVAVFWAAVLLVGIIAVARTPEGSRRALT
ncbi:MFS transporter [Microbacterium kribbense]|uniref:MFS transporter n=1 Tax=Microbacterium kribbense TaxID=433645 RepID=A0ABP7G9I9_9MICO